VIIQEDNWKDVKTPLMISNDNSNDCILRILPLQNECQQSVNGFQRCKCGNQLQTLSLWSITRLLVADICRKGIYDIATIYEKWASTEHQQFPVIYAWYLRSDCGVVIHDEYIGRRYRLPVPLWDWASTERPWCLVVLVRYSSRWLVGGNK